MFERFGVELMASNLALQGPETTINVEDPMAKEFIEDVKKARALDVVGEVGDKEVLYVDRICSADSTGE